jgi:hypothetical protein
MGNEKKDWRTPGQYEGYTGGLHNEWNNPPAPFNPDFDPKAEARYAEVTASMQADEFYANHTREECKAEWRRRYDALKARDYPDLDEEEPSAPGPSL